MNFIVLEGDSAKDFFENENVNYKEDPFIEEWLTGGDVKLYLLYENDKLKSFALLTKLNKDPLKLHSNPHYLNYIYTLEDYRRVGHALSLLKYIKNLENTTAFCTDDIAQSLFKKAEYVFNSHDEMYKFPIYRFP